MRPKSGWKGCPIRYAAAILGDPWTLVLLRDLLLQRKRHFRAFLIEEAPASNVLADRLARLEAAAIIVRRRDERRGNQVTCHLTEKGLALIPVLLAMIDWSEQHDAQTEVPAEFIAGYRADPVGFARDLADTLRGGPADR